MGIYPELILIVKEAFYRAFLLMNTLIKIAKSSSKSTSDIFESILQSNNLRRLFDISVVALFLMFSYLYHLVTTNSHHHKLIGHTKLSMLLSICRRKVVPHVGQSSIRIAFNYSARSNDLIICWANVAMLAPLLLVHFHSEAAGGCKRNAFRF